MEIKLPSCSNIHLFKNLHLFLDQNHIPIQITTTPDTTPFPIEDTLTKPTPMIGGEKYNELKLEINENTNTNIDPAHIIYKPAYTPYTVFSQLLDSIFFQKQRDYDEDIQNQPFINSILPQKKNTPPPQTPITKTPETEKVSSLYIHINTNQPNSLESIRGTKLYYLYQRQIEDPTICAHFV